MIMITYHFMWFFNMAINYFFYFSIKHHQKSFSSFFFFFVGFPNFIERNKNWLAPKKDRIKYTELICFGYKNLNVCLCIMWIRLHLHSIKHWKKQKRKNIKRLNKNNNVISAIILYLHFLIQFRLVDWFSRTQCN